MLPGGSDSGNENSSIEPKSTVNSKRVSRGNKVFCFVLEMGLFQYQVLQNVHASKKPGSGLIRHFQKPSAFFLVAYKAQ